MFKWHCCFRSHPPGVCLCIEIFAIQMVLTYLEYARNDILISKDTYEVDYPHHAEKMEGSLIHHYIMPNTSHLGCCSSPFGHLIWAPTT